MDQLGETAKEIRMAMGFSQKEAAHKLGVTPVYLCNVEKGKAMPSHAFLAKFQEWSSVDLYVAAWCKKSKHSNLPKSVESIAKQLSAIWDQSIIDLKHNMDGNHASNSKTKTPR